MYTWNGILYIYCQNSYNKAEFIGFGETALKSRCFDSQKSTKYQEHGVLYCDFVCV